jgi:SAM-dependent methyltransferase
MPAYGALSTQFYDADKPRASATEVAWYAERLPDVTEPVLEVMCGSGRLLIPLLEEGLTVHGCDVSAAMLASCEARLDALGYARTLFRQDATALNLPFRYAAAFIAAGSFQLLADPVAALSALERIRAHLVDPGYLFLDLFVPAEAAHPPGAPIIEARTATLADGTRIAYRAETRVDVENRRIDVQSRYEKRTGPLILAREDEALALTWYDEQEIAGLLTRAGYRDVTLEPAAWASTRGAPEGERRFAVRARA